MILEWKEKDSAEGYLLVERSRIGTTRKDKPFLDLILTNGIADIPGKRWDYDGQCPLVGKCLFLRVGVQMYNNQPQLIITDFREVPPEEFSAIRFLPSIDEATIRELQARYQQTIDSLPEEYKAVVQAVMDGETGMK
ncbi:MAG: hypothetical protein ACYCX4_00350 [Bacillota bacterium]